jgi:hypothetical protein
MKDTVLNIIQALILYGYKIINFIYSASINRYYIKSLIGNNKLYKLAHAPKLYFTG